MLLFSVFGNNNAFSHALVSKLAHFGAAKLSVSLAELLAEPAANVIEVIDFHGKEVLPANKKLLTVCLIRNLQDVSPRSHVYFVHEDSDPNDAAALIVKRLSGFEKSKSCLVSPYSDSVEGVTHLLAKPFVKPTIAVPSPLPVRPIAPVLSKAVTQPSARHPKASHHYSKRVVKAVSVVSFILLWIVMLPYLLLLSTAGVGLFSVKLASRPQSFLAQSSITLTRSLSSATVSSSQFASTLPLIGAIYTTPLELGQFAYQVSSIGKDLLPLAQSIQASQSLSQIKSASPTLLKLARDVSYVGSSSTVSFLSTWYPTLPSLLKNASIIHLMASIASHADAALGENKPVTYAVLLQNNMELRPTGGFIGSFMLVEIDKGKVSSKDLYDVYDADGQLTGYVKPPDPLRDYLGEASWHLRDSNWDPDFATSAERAAWFLDKSINKQVDGVVGVNLEVLRTLVSVLGPIEVADYGTKLTSENFYATIQNEVHKEFFPGSRKKSNYLTAVFNSIMQKLGTAGVSKALPLFVGLSKNIASHDIQLYMANNDLQTEVIKAGIGGEVPENSFGFVEANLGVNKANQFIERRGEWTLDKTAEEGSVTGSLEIANKARGVSDETRYRVYVRALAPSEASFTSLKVTVNGIQQPSLADTVVTKNRKEIGTFVELKAGETAILTVSFATPSFSRLTIWKQAGVPTYPLSIKTLTSSGERAYNRQLDSNIIIPL